MTADPRAALALLVSALERHLEVATTRRDPDDPGVIAAAEGKVTVYVGLDDEDVDFDDTDDEDDDDDEEDDDEDDEDEDERS